MGSLDGVMLPSSGRMKLVLMEGEPLIVSNRLALAQSICVALRD